MLLHIENARLIDPEAGSDSLGSLTVKDGLIVAKGGRAETIQVEYSLLQQEPVEEIFPLAQAANVGIIARLPLKRGILTSGAHEADGITPHGLIHVHPPGGVHDEVGKPMLAGMLQRGARESLTVRAAYLGADD